jgi:hypothetical protein
MKKIKIEKKELKKIISDLEKASDTIDSIGMWFIELDIMEEDEEKQYSEAEGKKLAIPATLRRKAVKYVTVLF